MASPLEGSEAEEAEEEEEDVEDARRRRGERAAHLQAGLTLSPEARPLEEGMATHSGILT